MLPTKSEKQSVRFFPRLSFEMHDLDDVQGTRPKKRMKLPIHEEPPLKVGRGLAPCLSTCVFVRHHYLLLKLDLLVFTPIPDLLNYMPVLD